MSQRQRRDHYGRPIRSQGDYARMIMTALVLFVLLIALFAVAYWLNEKYSISQQIPLPSQISTRLSPATRTQMMNICVPLALALILFTVLQSFVATLMSRFYRNPKDELDEDGMYKRRDY